MIMTVSSYVLLSVVVANFIFPGYNGVDCLHMEGRLSTKQSWSFLSRFCFLSNIGRMEYKFVYSKAACCYNVLLYFDGGHQWSSVYLNDSKSCAEKEGILQPSSNQIINLTVDYRWSNCRVDDNSSTEEENLICTGGRSFRSLQEQWWYIAISNCQGKKEGIYLDYELELTNGHSFWTKQFSADEFGILETDILFVLLFSCMFVLSIVVANNLQGRQMLHVTYKIFMLCLFFEVLGLLNLCIALGTYASDGVGNESLKLFGRGLGTAAEIFFLLLLLLLANGFTVTRGRLSYSGTIKMTVFITLFTIINSTLFIYEYMLSDPGLVLYVFESPAGIGVIILRFFAWLWFSRSTLVTLKHYPEKQTFYFPLYGIYSLWFFSQPLMVLISSNLIPKYMRAKLVNAIDLLIDLLAYGFFLSLMRPRTANKNFPYHVRTSQIGSCETDERQSFPHCVYQSNSTNSDVHVTTYDIFTVQRPEPAATVTSSSHNNEDQSDDQTSPPSYEEVAADMVETF